MRKVLEDLDFASTHCITNAKLEVNSVRITRNVALAFKARCCLYEGTFRKYHANDPSTGKPWTADESEMYLRACADACETLMGEGKYALVSDPAKVATQYRSLFTSESVASGEVIWGARLRRFAQRHAYPQYLFREYAVRQLLAHAPVRQYLPQPGRQPFHRQGGV